VTVAWVAPSPSGDRPPAVSILPVEGRDSRMRRRDGMVMPVAGPRWTWGDSWLIRVQRGPGGGRRWQSLGVSEVGRDSGPGNAPDTEATMRRETITLSKIREFLTTGLLAARFFKALHDLAVMLF
jgi:hypothetical protein